MNRFADLTAADLGRDLIDLLPERFERQASIHGSILVRICHEAGLRRGTFVGFTTAEDFSAGLQHWGFFDPGLPEPAGVTVDGLTAGKLTARHLTEVCGRALRPDDSGVPSEASLSDIDHDPDRTRLTYGEGPRIDALTDAPVF